jgi:hypothetical protein
MPATICYIDKPSTANIPLKKRDTTNNGAIDEAGLKTATETDNAAAGNSAVTLKQLDNNGKVSRSALSTAIDNLGDQLNAQLDQARASGATAAAHSGADDAAANKKVLAASAQSKAQAQLQQYRNNSEAVGLTASSSISVSA